MIYEPVDNAELRVLIDLADDRRQVQTTTAGPRLAVVIPEELYERLLKYKSLDSSSPKEPKKREKKS